MNEFTQKILLELLTELKSCLKDLLFGISSLEAVYSGNGFKHYDNADFNTSYEKEEHDVLVFLASTRGFEIAALASFKLMKMHLNIHALPKRNNLYDRIQSYHDLLRLPHLDHWYQIANESLDLNRHFEQEEMEDRVYAYLKYLQDFGDFYTLVNEDILNINKTIIKSKS